MKAFDKASLKKRYGWTGEKYADLISKIVKENKTAIGERVANSGKRRFETSLKDILPKGREKIVRLPDVSNIVRRSPTIIKAATQGELIMKTVRERMRKDVSQAMIETGINTKHGTINKNMRKALKRNLNDTFDGYTKRDPKFNRPNNIEAIVVTETQSVANQVRKDYAKAVSDTVQDSGFKMTKTWIHNRPRKSTPRQNHAFMHGTEIDLDDFFELLGADGVLYNVDGPYDSKLPASEVITCRCELRYRWRKVKK